MIFKNNNTKLSETGFITKTVHHSRISTILILHNIFTPGLRTASLSLDYMVIFNFPRDRSTITSIARQVFPENSKFLREVYEFVCRQPHGYLFIDLTPRQNHQFRVRNSVFNDPDTMIFSPY